MLVVRRTLVGCGGVPLHVRAVDHGGIGGRDGDGGCRHEGDVPSLGGVPAPAVRVEVRDQEALGRAGGDCGGISQRHVDVVADAKSLVVARLDTGMEGVVDGLAACDLVCQDNRQVAACVLPDDLKRVALHVVVNDLHLGCGSGCLRCCFVGLGRRRVGVRGRGIRLGCGGVRGRCSGVGAGCCRCRCVRGGLGVLVRLLVLVHGRVAGGSARGALGCEDGHGLADDRVAHGLSVQAALHDHVYLAGLLVALPRHEVGAVGLGCNDGAAVPLEGHEDVQALPFGVEVENDLILADGALDERAVADGAAALYDLHDMSSHLSPFYEKRGRSRSPAHRPKLRRICRPRLQGPRSGSFRCTPCTCPSSSRRTR